MIPRVTSYIKVRVKNPVTVYLYYSRLNVSTATDSLRYGSYREGGAFGLIQPKTNLQINSLNLNFFSYHDVSL